MNNNASIRAKQIAFNVLEGSEIILFMPFWLGVCNSQWLVGHFFSIQHTNSNS